MVRPPVPGSVTTGRVLLIVEGVLWLLLGALVLIVGIGVAALGHSFTFNGQTTSVGGAATAAGVAVIVVGAILVALSITGIWSGAAMGRLTGGPRVTGLVLASLGLLLGILSAVGGSETFTNASTGTTYQSSPVPGIVLIVVNALIIWGIGLSGSARAAFGGLRPAGYPIAPPLGYGPAPGYPMAPPYGPPAWPPAPYPGPPGQAPPPQGYPAAPPPAPPTGPPGYPPAPPAGP
jgi:hypothetical protein